MILFALHCWIVGLWVAFLIYWAIAAIFVKRGADRMSLRRGMKMRFALFLIIVITALFARRSAELRSLQWTELHSIPMAVTGALLVTLGATVAFVARGVIGRNWGSPGMRKTDTKLVTHGPYSLIRHPIYTGILLMMAGTAVGLTPIWWSVMLVAGIYFIRSARAEESYMTERFPDAYPAYKSRTKMLVPFLL
ncbi:MAG TPA: isoprenylcysteine carboxylmethyltransferase family protein [Sphingomicrobium sp.]|nr:isoprenylcysteine carboxylmethyltransferase family protein [Sphingomicrobium sp.]